MLCAEQDCLPCCGGDLRRAVGCQGRTRPGVRPRLPSLKITQYLQIVVSSRACTRGATKTAVFSRLLPRFCPGTRFGPGFLSPPEDLILKETRATASAAEGRSSKYIYARGSRGLLSNIEYHMLYHMQERMHLQITCLGWILAASMQTRQYSFHQEQEHPDG